MIAFEEYQRLVSPLRVFAVITLTPLPALIVVLLLAAIPLQSPLLSATENPTYFIQSWLSFSVITFGMLLYMRCALALPLTVYSHQQCALISLLTAGANELVMFVISVVWRFPIPLRDYVGAPSYTAFFIFFHILVLRGKLRHFYYRIREYLPLYFAQVSTFFVFEGVAILFRNSPVWVKTFITISYPVLRAVLRRIFGFSTLYQLAFVLEKYWMSVQGKFVGSFTLIFVLNIVHQGTDLSLQFNWGQILKRPPCSQ
ncbi:hypothetical protein PR002_g9461 [Phytophthora rubi]|uniref:Uncharacterized protein n=1 Tax=Phytophthora rubi TaxID=129364 RepID=A0A6A3MSW1_9STRA|nr:hypothetical protein PR002_g9461 [Phytophthora rubi]